MFLNSYVKIKKRSGVELKRRFSFRRYLFVLYTLVFAPYLNVSVFSARAISGVVMGNISIPSINLKSDVISLAPEDKHLETPDYIVGSFSRNKNKTLLIGHSTTIFSNLSEVKIGDQISYNDKKFIVSSIDIVEKDKIIMREILSSSEEDTIVIMTCAGELFENGDATHHLIITAVKIDN